MKALVENLLAIVLYYSGLIKILRQIGRKYAKILIYHSISDEENCFIKSPTNIWVYHRLFIDHMEYIKKYYNVVSLQQLIESIKKGQLTPGSLVITFDDGFADNYRFAYPVLKKFRLPATIFIATEPIDEKKPLWLQQLNYLINKYSIDRITELIDGNGNLCNPKLKNLIKQAACKEEKSKKLEQFMTYELSKSQRAHIISYMYQQLNISSESIFSKNKIYLDWEEIKEMHRYGIAFGNHGQSHSVFVTMSLKEQGYEIENSMKLIRKNLNSNFMPFAYPFGQKRCWYCRDSLWC